MGEVVSLHRYRQARTVHSSFDSGYSEALFLQQADAGLVSYLEVDIGGHGFQIPIDQIQQLVSEFPRKRNIKYLPKESQ